MIKKKKDVDAISDEQEFLFVLVFTFLIPVIVTLIQLILNWPGNFLGVCDVYIPNIVTSILAYTGVVILQSLIQTAKAKGKLSVWTLRSFLLLIACSIPYAGCLTYNALNDCVKNNFVVLFLSITTIILSGALLPLCVLVHKDDARRPERRKRRKYSGEDY